MLPLAHKFFTNPLPLPQQYPLHYYLISAFKYIDAITVSIKKFTSINFVFDLFIISVFVVLKNGRLIVYQPTTVAQYFATMFSTKPIEKRKRIKDRKWAIMRRKQSITDAFSRSWPYGWSKYIQRFVSFLLNLRAQKLIMQKIRLRIKESFPKNLYLVLSYNLNYIYFTKTWYHKTSTDTPDKTQSLRCWQ